MFRPDTYLPQNVCKTFFIVVQFQIRTDPQILIKHPDIGFHANQFGCFRVFFFLSTQTEGWKDLSRHRDARATEALFQCMV
jgi:hypothetical protein